MNLTTSAIQFLIIKVIIIIIATLTIPVNSGCYEKAINPEILQIQCSDYDTDLKIICRSNAWTNFLAELNRPTVSTIEFENCNFPDTMSVQEILQSMNITVDFKLKLTNPTNTLSRHNFQRLSVFQLELYGGNISELPVDLLYNMTNLEELVIRSTNITRIPEGFFADWAENILKIQLINNKLQKITKNFAHLENLMSLDLSTNEINEIEPGAFDNLLKLNKILLENNHLRNLPPSIFHRLTRLTDINLCKNSFDKFSEDLFSKAKNLKNFVMTSNKGNLQYLPFRFFKDCVHLEIVNISHNHLEMIPADVFTGCTKLTRLILSYNLMITLMDGLFDDTENLVFLEITSNRLKYLPESIFGKLRHLKQLYLNKNQLTFLSQGDLKGLQSLEYLYVSENNLIDVDINFIMYLKSTNYIDFSYNHLTFNCPKVIKRNNSYKRYWPGQNDSLLISYESEFCRNSSINNQIYQQLTLKHINLNHNRISRFNDRVLDILSFSNTVDLRNNRISKINLSMLSTELTEIQTSARQPVTIFLNDNPLHCDCHIINFIQYLKSENNSEPYRIISTKSNDIFSNEKIACASPPQFEGIEVSNLRMEELSCLLKTDDLVCKTCNCWEYPAKQVLSVDCSYKNLTELSLNIKELKDWSIELNMTGNMLQSFNGSYLTNLISLDLSNNNFTKVTMDLFSPKLQHLKLHGNNIPRLDSDVINFLNRNYSNLRTLTLHDNKWICYCGARQFLNLIQTNLIKYNLQGVTCYETNKQMYKMTDTELCENLIITAILVGISITVFAIILVIFMFFYYKYQREIKIWLHSKQLCLWLVTENELDNDKKYDAFISFSHKDEDFVKKEIVAKLEEGSNPYKLCLHYRDWLAGEWIPIQISRSVAESKRTIVILTPNFIESIWGLLEFRAAHTQTIEEGRTRLIVILHGDINVDELDSEMKIYLKLNTYIEWDDPWFWDKLKCALPSHTKH